ncbi:MAG: serine hydrolase [Pseudomonadota bacterium]
MNDHFSLSVARAMRCCLAAVGSIVGSMALFSGATFAADCPKPASLKDGWDVSTPDKVGLDCAKLLEAVAAIDSGRYGRVNLLIVAREGKIVFEKYWDGRQPPYDPGNGAFEAYKETSFDENTVTDMMSMTKSLIATAAGVAEKQGLISHVGDSVASYLPYDPFYQTEAVRRITIRDMLTMSAGLKFDENTYPYGHPKNDLTAVYGAVAKDEDALPIIFNQPAVSPPGAVFNYASTLSHSTGRIVERQAGMRFDRYVRDHLLDPLEIGSVYWSNPDSETYKFWGDISMRPRDFAKIPQLHVNGGRWKGEQIISERWARDALLDHAFVSDGQDTSDKTVRRYGYFWWTKEVAGDQPVKRYAYASGFGGQFAAAIPELDLVVVGLASNWPEDWDPKDEGYARDDYALDDVVRDRPVWGYNMIIDEFILSAVKAP